LFKIRIAKDTRNFLQKVWPGKISVILPCPYKKFTYLHRGAKTLAFRLPAKKDLIKLLKKTGPLVAPTANPEGLKPAKTVREAKRYFGNKIDFYVNQGKLNSLSSILVAVKNGQVVVKRRGAVKLALRSP